jgi:DNA-binding MarR family transcriptional regulator
MWLMKRAFYQQRRALDEAVRPDGVTAAQAGVLSRLSEQPGLSGADLARELLITPQASQVALTALERRGLVERRPDASHGRILRAFLTAEGRRLARLCTNAAVELQDKLLAGFDRDERASLVDFLNRMIEHGPSGDEAVELDA